MASVSIEKVMDKFNLTNLTPQIDLTNIKIQQPDVNRPALQLAGYFEHFEETRLQIIGFVEYSYMEYLPEGRKKDVYPKLISDKTPCFILQRSQHHLLWQISLSGSMYGLRHVFPYMVYLWMCMVRAF